MARVLSFDPNSPKSIDKFTFEAFDPLSTCVATMDYDPFSEELTIEFQQRGTYVYDGVPPSVAYELAVADSPGTYFNKNIRPRYSYQAI